MIEKIEDLIEFTKKHGSFEEFMHGIQNIRTRYYSRISAIVKTSECCITLKDVCEKGKVDWIYGRPTELCILYNYVRRVVDCRKPYARIYRGGSPIKVGDWVALTYEYASWHGKVYSKAVRVEDVVWAMTSPEEWYYVPKELQGKFKDFRDWWMFCNSIL